MTTFVPSSIEMATPSDGRFLELTIVPTYCAQGQVGFLAVQDGDRLVIRPIVGTTIVRCARTPPRIRLRVHVGAFEPSALVLSGRSENIVTEVQ